MGGFLPDLPYIVLHCVPHMRFRQPCSCSYASTTAVVEHPNAGRAEARIEQTFKPRTLTETGP